MRITKRVLAIGDIHGGHKALLQCLERANFNNDKDILISLGDIVDGWGESYECVEELLKIKNLVAIRGNHDEYFKRFIEGQLHPVSWAQGGRATLMSYCKNLNSSYYISKTTTSTVLIGEDVPESHRDFFIEKQTNYLEMELNSKRYLFVHGGYNRHYNIDDPIHNPEEVLLWDRDLLYQAISFNGLAHYKTDEPMRFRINGGYDNVFIGHTTTEMWKYAKNNLPEGVDVSEIGKRIVTPLILGPVVALDTGAGWSGKLTIMDIESKEFWQSDTVSELYPNEKGRR
jgi:serine/threonine protein phosphatase 1